MTRDMKISQMSDWSRWGLSLSRSQGHTKQPKHSVFVSFIDTADDFRSNNDTYIQDRVLTCLDTSDPAIPMATPMSAFLRAGESLTPSPVTATIAPKRWQPSTMISFCCGEVRANTISVWNLVKEYVVKIIYVRKKANIVTFTCSKNTLPYWYFGTIEG